MDRRLKRERCLKAKLGGKLEAHDTESGKNRSPKTKGNPKMRKLNPSFFLLLPSLPLTFSVLPFQFLCFHVSPTSFEEPFLMLLLP